MAYMRLEPFFQFELLAKNRDYRLGLVNSLLQLLDNIRGEVIEENPHRSAFSRTLKSTVDQNDSSRRYLNVAQVSL